MLIVPRLRQGIGPNALTKGRKTATPDSDLNFISFVEKNILEATKSAG